MVTETTEKGTDERRELNGRGGGALMANIYFKQRAKNQSEKRRLL